MVALEKSESEKEFMSGPLSEKAPGGAVRPYIDVLGIVFGMVERGEEISATHHAAFFDVNVTHSALVHL